MPGTPTLTAVAAWLAMPYRTGAPTSVVMQPESDKRLSRRSADAYDPVYTTSPATAAPAGGLAARSTALRSIVSRAAR